MMTPPLFLSLFPATRHCICKGRIWFYFVLQEGMWFHMFTHCECVSQEIVAEQNAHD